jgi:hypothetical protein
MPSPQAISYVLERLYDKAEKAPSPTIYNTAIHILLWMEDLKPSDDAPITIRNLTQEANDIYRK